MHRFFVPSSQIMPDQIEITGKEVNHIKNVLRLAIGDQIELFDETGTAYQVKIKTLLPDKIICSILGTAKNKDNELPVKVTLAQCLPKGKKMDLIIQKAVELGAYAIIPVSSDRTVVKLAQSKGRWQTIAKEAAQQCGRAVVPQIMELQSFDQLLQKAKEYDLVLISWEEEKAISLKAQIRERSFNNILAVIGPEGGFSANEIERANAAGAMPITLGKRILRTETVALSILSMIIYEIEL